MLPLSKSSLQPVDDTDLAACEEEPIHTPGAIQPDGILLAARWPDLTVTHVSANFARSTGVSRHDVFGAPLGAILGDANTQALLDALERQPGGMVHAQPMIFPFVRDTERVAVAHRYRGSVIVELEPRRATLHRGTFIDRAQSAIEGLRSASDVGSLSDLTVRHVRELTDYDRVMIYRFDTDGHGEVIAEDRDQAIEPFLGLHFPATDIPAQARRLFAIQRVRGISDSRIEPIPLIADPSLGDSQPLDMSRCALRAVSPIHRAYLCNMGVAASLVIAILQDGKLWGLISCHHRTPRPVDPELRALCDLIGQLFGLMLGQVSGRDRLRGEIDRQRIVMRIANRVERGASVIDGLLENDADFLALVDANGAFVRLGGRTICLGQTPPSELADDLLDATIAGGGEGLAVDHASLTIPGLDAWTDRASGLLVLPIPNSPGDGIVWFRPEFAHMVRWGGDPRIRALIDRDSGVLTPRASFAAWAEIVSGRSRPWSDVDMAAARDLRRLVTGALLRQTERNLASLSSFDPLTGLANRRLIEQRLVEWRARPDAPPASLIFFDLDRFKTVNDSLGHAAGDELLVQIARRVAAVVPPEHLFGRLGGDEFVVFCENIAPADAMALASAILASFAEPLTIVGKPYLSATSIGVAHGAGVSADLLREADSAMYAAKRSGRSRVVVFDEALHSKILATLQTEQDLVGAMDREEFVAFFQPVVSVATRRVIGFESLVRWRHPERGWVSPSEFVPRAEENGLIDRIGESVARQAIEALACFPDPTVYVTVNVSPYQLKSGHFVDRISQIATEYAVEPRRITLEVTEGAMMDDESIKELHRLREAGFRIAIDDFGTGYSSLAYLRRLPVDAIKIDRSFVRDAAESLAGARLLSVLVGLGQALGLYVIAEGVETDEQMQLVAGTSCQAVQGFLYGRPMPFDEATHRLLAD